MSEYLEENLQDEEILTEEEKKFSCENDHDAEYLLNYIKRTEADFDFWKQYYKEQIQKMDVIRNRKRAWAEYHLSQYFRKVPHKVTKTGENYQLPSGKLVWKRQDPKFDTEDPAFLDWLKGHNLTDYIKVEESARWGDFRKSLMKTEDGRFVLMQDNEGVWRVVTMDGEVVPGVVATPQPDTFGVEGLKK